MNNIIRQLDELADVRDLIASLQAAREEIIERSLPPDALKRLREMDTEIESLSTREAELETEIKRLVLERGTSVRGTRLHAVYIPPRVTWNTAALDGYMIAHPEIAAFRRVGAASVSIRRVVVR